MIMNYEFYAKRFAQIHSNHFRRQNNSKNKQIKQQGWKICEMMEDSSDYFFSVSHPSYELIHLAMEKCLFSYSFKSVHTLLVCTSISIIMYEKSLMKRCGTQTSQTTTILNLILDMDNCMDVCATALEITERIKEQLRQWNTNWQRRYKWKGVFQIELENLFRSRSLSLQESVLNSHIMSSVRNFSIYMPFAFVHTAYIK